MNDDIITEGETPEEETPQVITCSGGVTLRPMAGGFSG